MTIARLRVGQRYFSLNIGLEFARQDPSSAQGQLEARYQRDLARKALNQQSQAWDTQMLHLARRPV